MTGPCELQRMKGIAESNSNKEMSGQIVGMLAVPQSSNPNVARRLNLLWKYLDATGLQRLLEDLYAKLLRTELPQNPYPILFRQVQQQAEGFRLTKFTPSERILPDLSLPTVSTATGYVSGASSSSQVWGLPSVLRCVSPAHVRQYHQLLASVTPPPTSLPRSPAYSVQVIAALTGPGIFTGTFYDLPPAVDVLLNFIIISSDVQRAVSVYADCIRNDIRRTVKQENHLVFRLVIPIDKTGQRKVFSRDQLTDLPDDFHSCVSAAVSVKQMAQLQCLWRLNVNGGDFIMGAKLYSLSLIRPSDEYVEERVFDYSELPLIHLYSSVFLQQSHAEVYCGMFIPRKEAIDKDLQHPRSKASHNPQPSEWPRDAQKSISTPSKAPLHGFQYTGQGKHCPDSSLVLQTIRASMLQRIACIPLSTGAFDITYFSILMILMELGNSGNQEHGPQMTDREQHLLEDLVQLHRFLHGSASRIWNILNQTQTICLLLESETVEVNHGEIYPVIADKCRKLVYDFLDSDYQKVSSDFATLGRILKRGVVSALHALLEGPSRKLLSNFRAVLSVGTVMLIQTVEDSLPWVPVLIDMKKQAEGVCQETSPDNQQVNSEHSPNGAPILSHTREQYINLAGNTMDVKSTGQEEQDAALIKYCVDCRLDWHWEQCLQAIFSELPLPPNPYPTVASEFIKASLRMELWQKKDEEIIHQTLYFTRKLIDHENHIFQIPDFEAFGLKSALCTLNLNTFPSVLEQSSLMGNSNFPYQCQDFKVAVGLSVNTSATWLSSLIPFQNGLELNEFYYLKGPRGCHEEALQAYANIVHRHLAELRVRLKRAQTFTMWLSEGHRWTADDILTYQSAFTEALALSAARGHQTYLKVLQSAPGSPWHYLPIIKYFVLYYFEDEEERWQCFPHHDSVGLYQNVFLSKEAVMFHFQRVDLAVHQPKGVVGKGDIVSERNHPVQVQQRLEGGPKTELLEELSPLGDPFSGRNLHKVMTVLDADILNSFLKEDILGTYRLVALKCLISQHYDIIPACWRMLHSLAAKLDHLNHLNETIQELLSDDIKPAGVSLGEVVDEALLMYEQELQIMLKNPSCLAPGGLLDVARSKIHDIDTSVGGKSNADLLKDVGVMCQAVANVVAWEIHALCPEMELLLHSLNKQSSVLPAVIALPPVQQMQ